MEEAEVKEKFTFEKIIDSLEKCLPTEQVDVARSAVEQTTIAMKEEEERLPLVNQSNPPVARTTLNRKQRREQMKRLRKLEKALSRPRPATKKIEVTPEEKEQLYRTLLAKVRAENAKFDAMKEEETGNERV